MITHRFVIGIVITVLLTGCGFSLLNQEPDEPAAVEATPVVTPTAQVTEADTPDFIARERAIVVDARVVPMRTAELNFATVGTVAEVLVEEGDTVAQGDALARLDTSELALRVEEARLTLADAEASYEQLQAGASPEEIEQARNRLATARAQLRLAEGNVTRQDIAAAEARLEEARVNLARLEAGPEPAEVQAAEEAVDQARNNLHLQRDTLSAAKANAQAQVNTAANALRNAQDAYSQLYWENQGKPDLTQADKDAEQVALRDVQDAQEALEQAQVGYDLAKEAEIIGIASAEDALNAAQRDLDELLAGADADELAAARAQVAAAESSLEKLVGDQRAANLEVAQAAVTEAQSNLDRLIAGPLPAELASAQRQIQRAEFGLKQAQQALTQATLTAPIDGTVAQLNLTVGRAPNAVETAAIVLADFSTWQLETSALTELDITRIRVGDPAQATFDALPDLELPGKVTRIGAIGNDEGGSITYQVIITLDESDERLRWNMTASVNILGSR